VALAQPIDAAPAAPKVDAQALYKEATEQYRSGSYEQALELAERGLAAEPKDRKLKALKEKAAAKLGDALFDKGRKLLEQRDYAGALDAYEAVLKFTRTGQKHRVAAKAVKDLSPARTTSLEITVTNGPADVFLETRTLGAVCAEATTCQKAWLPGDYDVFAETRRTGFRRWTGSITVQKDQVAKLSITLDQEPSQLVTRQRREDDRRCIDIYLTEAGTTLVQSIMQPHVAQVVQALNVLSATEQEQLAALCRTLGLAQG
jgi:hypothetical protein